MNGWCVNCEYKYRWLNQEPCKSCTAQNLWEKEKPEEETPKKDKDDSDDDEH